VALGGLDGDGGGGEEEQADKQNKDYRQERLELPNDANTFHFDILRPDLAYGNAWKEHDAPTLVEWAVIFVSLAMLGHTAFG